MGWLNPQLVPEGLDLDTAIFYGARWIAPDDIVWDRHAVSKPDGPSNQRAEFIDWLNGGVLGYASSMSRELHDQWIMHGSCAEIVTLYEDEYGFVIASDFASCGYTYVGAFRKCDLPGYSVAPVPGRSGNPTLA